MAQPNKASKTMSSRLLTMKFMQRAAASPSSSPSNPGEPPSKKQRLSNGSSFHSSPPSTPRSDAQVVQEALAADEQKRADALEREAAGRGESKWYLSFKEPQTSAVTAPLRIVSAGYSTLDGSGAQLDRSSEEDEQEHVRPILRGRKSFGKFNRAVEKQDNPDLSSSDSGSESEDSVGDPGEDEDDGDDPTGANALIAQARKEAGDKARAERKARRREDKAEAMRMAQERRKKEVKLNHLTSISGGGSTGSTPNREPTKLVCFNCNEPGHLKRDCPQPKKYTPGR